MKIKAVIKSINDNLFNVLVSDKRLRNHALVNNDSPKLTMENYLTGYLNLSSGTIKALGDKYYYYVHLKSPESVDDRRTCISQYFNAEVSWQSLTHVRLLDIARIALDLHIPIEQLLYGTKDTRKIGRFNYCHYDDLGKIRRDYLVLQNKRFRTVAKCAEYWHLHAKKNGVYPYSKIAKGFGISRQMLYLYFNGKNFLLRKRSLYQSMCRMIGKSPVELMTYPLATRGYLRVFIKKHE